MIEKSDITGVILAGGKSSRFGSNKALYSVQEKTMLQCAIELLQPFCCDVCISGNCDEYAQYRIRCLPDEITDIGPLGGIYTAFKQCSTPYMLFLTCDMPFLTSPLISQLLSVDSNTQIACWKEASGDLQLFPLLLSRSLLSVIEEKIAAKSYNIRSLLQVCRHQCLSIAIKDQTCFQNINRLKDIAV